MRDRSQDIQYWSRTELMAEVGSLQSRMENLIEVARGFERERDEAREALAQSVRVLHQTHREAS